MDWTTDDLVEAVKLKVQSPSGGFQLSDQQVLNTAWEETIKRIVPPVRGVREDFWTTTLDVAITPNAPFIRIPARASQSTITDVWLVHSNGTTKPLARMPVERRFGMWADNPNGPEPIWYVLEGDKIIMYPTPQSTGMHLRFMYGRRPARYVPTSSCAYSDGNVGYIGDDLIVVVASSPLGITGYADMVQGGPPCDVIFDNQRFVYDVPTTTFTFLGDGSQDWQNMGIGTNEWICPAGTTCVPPLPDALHPALVDLTSAACMSAIGDYDRAASLREEIAEYFGALLNTLAYRVSGDPPRVFNRQSPIRQYGYGRGWWGYGN